MPTSTIREVGVDMAEASRRVWSPLSIWPRADPTLLRAFANESNSYMISVARHCSVHDPVHFEEGLDWGEWAEPDEKHLQHLMRHVFENREEAKEKGSLAREDAVGLWSWNNAGREARNHLRELLNQGARP